MKRVAATTAMAAAVVIAVVVYWSLRSPAPVDRADPGDADLVARGETVYAEACASCHGADFEGQPDWRIRGPDGKLPAPPHDETGHTWHHPDAVLFEMTKFGPQQFAGAGYATDMPGFADDLPDADIWAVLAYIKSRWPAKIAARQTALNERYEAELEKSR
jgi:mono/diheme cytochrome c family protein